MSAASVPAAAAPEAAVPGSAAPAGAVPLYLVAWTGGYEEASYQAFLTLPEAQACARDWFADSDQTDGSGDTVEVLCLTPGEGVRVERFDY